MGYLYAAYSNDGICWTANQTAIRYGGPSAPCIGVFANSVPVETVTALDDGSNIQLIGMEGDIVLLSDESQMDDTQTSIGFASPLYPSIVNLYGGTSHIANNGVYAPTGLTPPCCPMNHTYSWRFQSTNYFFNLQAAYDQASGDLYIGRAYTYPFDRGVIDPTTDPYQGDGWTPLFWQGEKGELFDSATGRTVKVSGCGQSKLALPNRIQLYKMHIGSLANFAALGNQSTAWTFLADLGNASGYTNAFTWPSSTPLTYWQTNAGRDYASVSFQRDGQGNLIRNADGSAKFFAGDTVMLSKSNGQCLVTGLERESLLAVP
jgi:hypothetical protein